jgi:four helix bundle protein
MRNLRFHPEAAEAVPEIRGADPTETFAFQRLDCYRVARELAARVHAASIADAELRDQATRASKSCFLTLCEGLPNDRPSMRRKYFTESNNSLHETVGAVDLAGAIGAVDARAAAEIQALAERLRRMLRGLMNPTGRGR